MRLHDFALERFFARWEFSAEMLLCASDVEGWPLAELLDLADDDGRRRWADLRLGYTESAGDPALRTEIASLYEHVAPDEVIVFSGAQEAIFALHNVLLGPGITPSWFVRLTSRWPRWHAPPAQRSRASIYWSRTAGSLTSRPFDRPFDRTHASSWSTNRTTRPAR